MLYPLFQKSGRQNVTEGKDISSVAFKDLLSGGLSSVPTTDISPGDVAILQYSGGTTGVSKGDCCPCFTPMVLLYASTLPFLQQVAWC
jgi:acyl-CoA synthetase (AMP-forming)/AMP-acid ligase II